MYKCPECGYSSDDGAEWHMFFCPSWPDKCAGCEMHESKLECPDCGYEWDLKDA